MQFSRLYINMKQMAYNQKSHQRASVQSFKNTVFISMVLFILRFFLPEYPDELFKLSKLNATILRRSYKLELFN